MAEHQIEMMFAYLFVIGQESFEKIVFAIAGAT